MAFLTHTLGYPRIGEKRELKKALESFWKGAISADELHAVASALRRRNWTVQQKAGIDLIPSNDFSLYDHVLDTSCLVGAVPPRFGWDGGLVSLETYFAMARGQTTETVAPALELTKWFDTNYHYLVPEFTRDQKFALSSTKVLDEFSEALSLGLRTKPVLLGPITFLLLGKCKDEIFNRLALLEQLIPIYESVLSDLERRGADWVQMDEPILVLDLDAETRRRFLPVYERLHAAAPKINLLLATYFGDLRENLSTALQLPVQGLHVDLTRAPDELDAVLAGLDKEVKLSLGLVDGRNVWKNDYAASRLWIEKAVHAVGADRLLLAPSCSLQHVPISLRNESELDPELRGWLSFAEEKLVELHDLADLTPERLEAYRHLHAARRSSPRLRNADVRDRCARVTPSDTRRKKTYAERAPIQRQKLALPHFPTTTIGSFPQTDQVRAVRSRFRAGAISAGEYERFIENEIRRVIELQEHLGLDVLVHGEFERTDMVEYFSEQLEGFAFTQNGWVQSYGSRCVKPPILYGDVRRPASMTVRWTAFAQSLTQRPVKGMLTGPVTILEWSFVRDDQPRRDTAQQIALAIRDEVADLEKAGLHIIQIDEPAFREGLPLRRADWPGYLDWAVEAFRLASAGVDDGTQIHTHMCYAEFNDIVGSIAALDADVISIEASRSHMDLLDAFARFKYPNEIGPGVWDIHSPRIPSRDEMIALLRKAALVLPPDKLWVNPDCGLKTRGYAEVIPALENVVAAARALR